MDQCSHALTMRVPHGISNNDSAIPTVKSATTTTAINTCHSPLYVPFKPLVCDVLILGFTRYSICSSCYYILVIFIRKRS